MGLSIKVGHAAEMKVCKAEFEERSKPGRIISIYLARRSDQLIIKLKVVSEVVAAD